MNPPLTAPPVLSTSIGDLPLGECRLTVGEREWSVLYTAAVVSRDDEAKFLAEQADRMPYGIALWPAAIALGHEIALRADEFRGKRVRELGAGTGLPGIIAAALGATVLQSDRNELALHVCRLNGSRNSSVAIDYQLADWAAWSDTHRYDWIIGSDILYAEGQHQNLRRIFECNLAVGGRVLVADPYRADSLPLLEALEASGWRVTHSRWSIGEKPDTRPIAVYELRPSHR